MLHRVGDVDLAIGEPGVGERFLQNSSRRPDKWFAGKVFVIAGLLTDEHHIGINIALAEHDLRRVFPQIASSAPFRLDLEVGELSLPRSFRIGSHDNCRCKFLAAPGTRRAADPVMEVLRIDIDELKQKMGRGERIIFLDARSKDAYEESTVQIPGSIRVPPDEVDAMLDEIPRHGGLIVPYCT